MVAQHRLLVVDDEEVICRACERVLSRQGFEVRTTCNAREGLRLAQENQYDAILLDIMMPELDGIRFLEELRGQKSNVPVIMITGYPSVPNATSAMRLGASDFITKPFTPEEITQAVRTVTRRGGTLPKPADAGPGPATEPWLAASDEVRFLDEAWFRAGTTGTARVGALLPRSLTAGLTALRLPRIGQIVHQGLPLAAGVKDGAIAWLMPSPLSGVVADVNEALAGGPGALVADPCGDGWLAGVCASRLAAEIPLTHLRVVVLANPDPASARLQADQLRFRGCRVQVVAKWEELAAAVGDPAQGLLILDAAGFGEEGPPLAGRVRVQWPALKIVVLGSASSDREAAYRAHRIFYFAIEPFADNEIVDVLDTAFRARAPEPAGRGPSAALNRIAVRRHDGCKVCLLASPGLLRDGDGLGFQIRQCLLQRAYPLETALGHTPLTGVQILQQGGACDRLFVLLATDAGRLPGSLIRDPSARLLAGSPVDPANVVFLSVQVPASGDAAAGFDARTTHWLAEHILQEMDLA